MIAAILGSASTKFGGPMECREGASGSDAAPYRKRGVQRRIRCSSESSSSSQVSSRIEGQVSTVNVLPYRPRPTTSSIAATERLPPSQSIMSISAPDRTAASTRSGEAFKRAVAVSLGTGIPLRNQASWGNDFVLSERKQYSIFVPV